MQSDVSVIDPAFYQLITDSVVECLKLIRQHQEDKQYIVGHHDYPKMSLRPNGMPDIRRSFLGSDEYPRDYTWILGKSTPSLSEHSSFEALLEYSVSNDRLKEYFLGDKVENRLMVSWIHDLPLQITDRYIHTINTVDFDEHVFLSLYKEIETGIYAPKLTVDIIFPILFVKFDVAESVIVADHVKLVRLDDKLQLARMRSLLGGGYQSSNPYVAEVATHGLLLENWSIPNKNILTSVSVSSGEFRNIIDNWIAAIRILYSYETGYSQVILKAVGWQGVYDTIADLPSIETQPVRFYPSRLDSGYVTARDNVPTIDADQLSELIKHFNKLTAIKNNNLNLAIKRLNRCLNREDEEDSILDACMALEALLSDGNTEIQHKLALRVAALSTLYHQNEKSPQQFFSTVKKVYKYRSDLIHANTNADKSRQITVEGSDKVDAVVAAIECLRMVLGVLIKYPEYLKPDKLDQILILQRLIST